MQPHTSDPSLFARPRLYSISAIDVATAFGSWLAGAVLISRNYSRLGDLDAARNAILVGIGATLALAAVVLSIPVPESGERALGYGVQGTQVAVVHLLASRLQRASLDSHAAAGGEFYSRWRALGVSLLVVPGAFVLFFVVAFLMPEAGALAE